MYLRRITPEPFGTAYPKFDGMISDDFTAVNRQFDTEVVPAVATSFERFGGGKHRQSDFEVCIEWKDVGKIIEKFCEAEHPEALAMREAMKLAAAAKNLGWQEPETASPQSH